MFSYSINQKRSLCKETESGSFCFSVYLANIIFAFPYEDREYKSCWRGVYSTGVEFAR